MSNYLRNVFFISIIIQLTRSGGESVDKEEKKKDQVYMHFGLKSKCDKSVKPDLFELDFTLEHRGEKTFYSKFHLSYNIKIPFDST